ncbi:MAG: hypothetical protein GY811_13140 [Myxococcales bacterium]|nr:hypothetical protein [Myxococcales bacterium]
MRFPLPKPTPAHSVLITALAEQHRRELEAEVLLKTFRQGLLFRLNGISIQIPPLRGRPEEVEPMARTFHERSCV